MFIAHLVALLGATTCLFFAALVAKKAVRLRHIPGPALARFTNVPRALWVHKGLSHLEHSSLHEKYGDVVVFGPGTVDISDPSALPTVYPMRPGFPKGDFYRTLMPFTRSGFALPLVFNTRDEDLHKQMKTPIASLFSMTNVLAFEKFIDEVIGILCEQLDKRFVATGETCDLGDWLQFFAFEVMATMTFSARYGFLEQGHDSNGLIDAIWAFMKTAAPVNNVLYKNRWAAKLRPTTGMPILNLALRNIEERRRIMDEEEKPGLSQQKGDMLDHFLRVQSSNPAVPVFAPTAWTFSNLIAGSDSTAVVLRTLWFNILRDADSGKALYRELEEANISSSHPPWAQICDLPYLNACVNEAVRLHPPFCLPFERVCPPEGIVVCGQFIPGGTNVGMNPYVVNRHKGTFGEDADRWRPERWIGGSAKGRKRMESAVLTFGFGRRICLGKNIALVEMKKVTVALLMRYRMGLVDAEHYRTENFWFFRQLGLKTRIERQA